MNCLAKLKKGALFRKKWDNAQECLLYLRHIAAYNFTLPHQTTEKRVRFKDDRKEGSSLPKCRYRSWRVMRYSVDIRV